VRIKFKKGKQREFLKKVLESVSCPSLRAFEQFGFDVPYSTLKNYYSEGRCLDEDFFNQLIEFSKLNKKNFEYEVFENNWGQSLGGKVSKRVKK